jgi:membrane-associated HD superfamily phosphohydrolase
MIEDVFSDIIKDGQLDESPLTLEEIAVIKRTFTQILVSIYHHRIPYPKATTSGQKKNSPEKVQGAFNAR